MHADPELGREGAFCDLAIDGGPGQAGSVEDGVQADDTIWVGHGFIASCWMFLIQTERRELLAQERPAHRRSRAWNGRQIGYVSETETASPGDVDAVTISQLRTESAARLHPNTQFGIAVGKDGFQLRIALQALGHLAHLRACRAVVGHRARPAVRQAGPIKVLPALHELRGPAL